jgi:pyrroline-5-carboxylate reductase
MSKEFHEQLTVGFLGAGAMGSALIQGMVNKGFIIPNNIKVYDICKDRVKRLEESVGICGVDDPTGLGRVDVLIIAVKPSQIKQALIGMKECLSQDTLLISIAAGVKISSIEQIMGLNYPIIRVMPNTPCLVGEGVCGISLGRLADAQHEAIAQQIFSSVGEAYVLPEELLDAVTGLSGSGPAYVCLIIEALADGGVLAGLPRELALKMATQTLLGTSKLVKQRLAIGEHPAKLKDQVASPGGTTIAGLSVLEQLNVRGALIKSVKEATARSVELGREI